MQLNLNRSTASAAAAVLIAGGAFAGGTLVSAEAGSPAAPSKAQVKKIAAKQAKKQIKKAAPTLSVGYASTAGSAGSAAVAGKLTNGDVRTFGVDVPNDGPAVVLDELGGLRIVATCPAGVPELHAVPVTPGSGGVYRYFIYNGSAVTTVGGGAATLPDVGSGNLAGGQSGNGTFNFRPGAARGVNAFYGWRHDGVGSCAYFGTMLGS